MSLIWKTSFVNSLKALMIGFPLQPLFCYGLECGKLTTLPRQAGEATQHGCLRRSPAPCKCLFLRGRESSWGLFTWNNTGSGLRNQHKTSGSDGHVLLKLHLFTEPVWPLHSGSLNTLHLYSLSSPSGSGLLTGVLEIPVNLQRCWVSENPSPLLCSLPKTHFIDGEESVSAIYWACFSSSWSLSPGGERWWWRGTESLGSTLQALG